MIEEEIIINGEKLKIVTKLPESEIESNDLNRSLDDTIELKELVEEIKNDK